MTAPATDVKVSDLLSDALVTLGAIQLGQTIDPALSQFVLRTLNRLFDGWNAVRAAVYTTSFATYTLTPALQPHTIGPSGTFNVSQRPVAIDAANIVLTSSGGNIHTPVDIRDDKWWLAQSIPSQPGPVPTDLYYAPTWPNGSLYLSPIPTAAVGLELLIRLVLGQVLITDTLSMPPGYQNAILLTLIEKMATPLGKQVPAQVTKDAGPARAAIYANNDPDVPLATQDAGMPTDRTAGRGNYLTGWWRR